MRDCKRGFAVLCICAGVIAGQARGQAVQMSTNPLKIKPGAQVGNKIRIKWTVSVKDAVLLQVVEAAV